MPDQFQKVEREDGVVVTDPAAIEEEIVLFYKRLYENYTTVVSEPASDVDFFNNIQPISGDEANCITKDITMAELADTVATCKDSAPGPDGIPYSLMRLLWYSYGKLLYESWRYSLEIKQLPPSHRISYLKLIPKAGKDLSKLTNWRPITLSNCDHKLITKIYAKRMCENVAKSIAERQTAYLKGRLINDNIRAIIGTINISNVENAAKGLIVALDAKKAFDSVDHSYIKEVLKRFGCEAFVPIFNTLYSDLETKIMINGNLSRSYHILRGVKQGDSLSCIIFIMCMEPLLRNIEANNSISPISSQSLGTDLPKVYAYADDVNGTIKDSERSLNCFFAEYERLTKLSGLELNAEKTEVMRLGINPPNRIYKVRYLNKEFDVPSCDKMKINGIIFQRDQDQMVTDNVAAARGRIDTNFTKWSRRSLTTLGKILVVKTFGISQIIYLLQSLVLKNAHIKVLNEILYKFVWNKHYHAAKAPERIKRLIVNTPIKLGGLGMLDLARLDEGLKVRALGRLLETNHPFLTLIKSKLDLNSFFNPSCTTTLDPITTQAVVSLRNYRDSLWNDAACIGSRPLLMEVNKSKISDLMSAAGKASINYFLIHRRGKRLVGDLTAGDLASLTNFIPRNKLPTIEAARPLRGEVTAGANESIIVGGKFKPIRSCSSKMLRDTLFKPELITNFKIGLNLTRGEALNWADRVSKLSSIRHRNVLLRIAHGDIYTKEKLHRFGLADSNKCERCDSPETLQHKFIECPYVKEIWRHLFTLTNTLISGNQLTTDPIKASLGASIEINLTIATINAEILQRILSLRDQNYLVHPKKLIEHALKLIHKREQVTAIKNEISSLLNASH